MSSNRSYKRQLEAVFALHKRGIEDALSMDCINGNCEHPDECEPVPMDICVECNRIAGDAYEEAPLVLWPCPTIQAATSPKGNKK